MVDKEKRGPRKKSPAMMRARALNRVRIQIGLIQRVANDPPLQSESSQPTLP